MFFQRFTVLLFFPALFFKTFDLTSFWLQGNDEHLEKQILEGITHPSFIELIKEKIFQQSTITGSAQLGELSSQSRLPEIQKTVFIEIIEKLNERSSQQSAITDSLPGELSSQFLNANENTSATIKQNYDTPNNVKEVEELPLYFPQENLSNTIQIKQLAKGIQYLKIICLYGVLKENYGEWNKFIESKLIGEDKPDFYFLQLPKGVTCPLAHRHLELNREVFGVNAEFCLVKVNHSAKNSQYLYHLGDRCSLYNSDLCETCGKGTSIQLKQTAKVNFLEKGISSIKECGIGHHRKRMRPYT